MFPRSEAFLWAPVFSIFLHVFHVDFFSHGLSLQLVFSSSNVTPTFYKNKFFVQIGVHIKMHIKL
jgi:hypothetical protein